MDWTTIFEGSGGAGRECVSFLTTDEAHSGRKVAAGAFAKGRGFGLSVWFELECRGKFWGEGLLGVLGGKGASGITFNLFQSMVNNGFSIFFVIVGRREFERHRIIFFAHAYIEFKCGWKGPYEIWAALEEAEVVVPSFEPVAASTAFAGFACESDKVACGFEPGRVREVFFAAIF